MNIVTIERYDPNQSRSFTPLIIDGYIVTRQRLNGTPHTRYCIMVDGALAASQISYPCPDDCHAAARRVRGEKNQRAREARVVQQTYETQPEPTGTLTDRAVIALQAEKMGLGKLAEKLKTNPDALSPILTRLVNRGRITRRGVRGKYVFEAA